MIPNQWYVILESNEVKGQQTDRLDALRRATGGVAQCAGHGQRHARSVSASRRGVERGRHSRRLPRVPVPRLSIRHERTLHVDPRQWPQRRAAQSHARQHVSHARSARLHLRVVRRTADRISAAALLRRDRRFILAQDGQRSLGHALLARDRKSTRRGASAVHPSHHHRARQQNDREWAAQPPRSPAPAKATCSKSGCTTKSIPVRRRSGPANCPHPRGILRCNFVIPTSGTIGSATTCTSSSPSCPSTTPTP